MKKYKQPEVCKPCWELKYCPYGPLVEQFPLGISASEAADPEAFQANVRTVYRQFLEAAAAETAAEAVADYVVPLIYFNPTTWTAALDCDPKESRCSVFGHICPVFIVAEGVSETKVQRRRSRAIPRAIFLKVVRRDNSTCQGCGAHLKDDEIEIDHMIPYGKGGATTVENLRVLCRTCNRRKSNSLRELLGGP